MHDHTHYWSLQSMFVYVMTWTDRGVCQFSGTMLSQEYFVAFIRYMSIIVTFVTAADIAKRPEVMFVAFGLTSAPAGLALTAPSRWSPVWKLAVEDLAEKHNGTLKFSYQLVPVRNCLAVADTGNSILAKWYYQLRRPGRVLVFINIGAENGEIKEADILSCSKANPNTSLSLRFPRCFLMHRMFGKWWLVVHTDGKLERPRNQCVSIIRSGKFLDLYSTVNQTQNCIYDVSCSLSLQS